MADSFGTLLGTENDGVCYYRTATGFFVAVADLTGDGHPETLASAFWQGRDMWNCSFTGYGPWTRLKEPYDWRDRASVDAAAVKVLCRFLASRGT